MFLNLDSFQTHLNFISSTNLFMDHRSDVDSETSENLNATLFRVRLGYETSFVLLEKHNNWFERKMKKLCDRISIFLLKYLIGQPINHARSVFT